MKRVPYGQRYWYDHMASGDVPLWERFMQQFPGVYSGVAYDVPVGGVPAHAEEPVVAGGANMAALYRRRIDAVGFKENQTDIIEVKPRASMSAIGQVLGYAHLYAQEHGDPQNVKAILVTDQADPDLASFAAAQGVLLVVV